MRPLYITIYGHPAAWRIGWTTTATKRNRLVNAQSVSAGAKAKAAACCHATALVYNVCIR
jgi:hypothetical protein